MVLGFFHRGFPDTPTKSRKGLGIGDSGGGMRRSVGSQSEGFACSNFLDELFHECAGVPVIHGLPFITVVDDCPPNRWASIGERFQSLAWRACR